MRVPWKIVAVAVAAASAACGSGTTGGQDASVPDASSAADGAMGLDASASLVDVDCNPSCGYVVLAGYPHDPAAFTQGLVVEGDVFFEGTGLRGQSTLRRVDVATGNVLQRINLDGQYFGEGITVWGNQVIQLTWQARQGFVFDKTSFLELRRFGYATEGWGLTHDGSRLIMSDGTATLYFLDPSTFQVSGSVEVRDNGVPVTQLNELEYVRGEIFANVWKSDFIFRIAPSDGRVVGKIDLTGIRGNDNRMPPEDVLNGIAYDAVRDRLFVTGKLWPKVFEIGLVGR